jgi:hypothetical protein
VTYNQVKNNAETIAFVIDPANDIMPPANAANLSVEQRTILQDYIAAGTPSAGDVSCF